MDIAEIIVGLIAGVGAGVATGFAGLSAAAVIAPLLMGFLDVPFYQAVGIALASDVLASAAAALTYKKNGNIDLKNGWILMLCVMVVAVLGSILAAVVTDYEIGNTGLGVWMIVCSLGLGISYVVRAGKSRTPNVARWRSFPKSIISIAAGVYIGFLCGFQGTGGGLMMLFALNVLLLIDFKKAIGTSVLVMTFTAFVGALSHFMLRGLPDLRLLVVSAAATLVAARISAVYANRMKEVTLKRITGSMLIVSGLILLFSKVFNA